MIFGVYSCRCPVLMSGISGSIKEGKGGNRVRKVVSVIHAGLAWLMLLAVLTEFFFAGLGVFQAASFQIHKKTGYAIGLSSVLMLVVALLGWLGSTRIYLSALLIVLMFIQMWLVHSPPSIAALHPVNAVVILFVVFKLVRMGVYGKMRSVS